MFTFRNINVKIKDIEIKQLKNLQVKLAY